MNQDERKQVGIRIHCIIDKTLLKIWTFIDQTGALKVLKIDFLRKTKGPQKSNYSWNLLLVLFLSVKIKINLFRSLGLTKKTCKKSVWVLLIFHKIHVLSDSRRKKIIRVELWGLPESLHMASLVKFWTLSHCLRGGQST